VALLYEFEDAKWVIRIRKSKHKQHIRKQKKSQKNK